MFKSWLRSDSCNVQRKAGFFHVNPCSTRATYIMGVRMYVLHIYVYMHIIYNYAFIQRCTHKLLPILKEAVAQVSYFKAVRINNH